jgi:two-component system sensor histidine kinase/response regulator
VFDEVMPVMNITPATHQQADTLPEQPARRLRVLVAEDHPLNQRLFALILSERGHDHVVASNGKEVLQILEQQSFDVILMDVQMPEMDGYQTTAEIRRRELATGTRTRIIAMTALALQQDRDLSLAAGMDDYIPKPIDRMDLLRRIEAVPLAADVARAAHATPLADAAPEPPFKGDDALGGKISPAK